MEMELCLQLRISAMTRRQRWEGILARDGYGASLLRNELKAAGLPVTADTMLDIHTMLQRHRCPFPDLEQCKVGMGRLAQAL